MNLYIDINRISKQLVTKVIFTSLIFIIISCKEVDPNFDADGDIKKGDIHFIAYGFNIEPPNSNWRVIRQIDSLRLSYGFEYQNRGCIAPDSIESIKMQEYNKQIERYLETKNGENWYKKYSHQLDSLNKLKYLKDSIK